MFAEGAEMLVMGSITEMLHRDWDLHPLLRGLMVSIVFVGFSAGNFVSGQIGDRFGRRRSILLSYALISCFGFATASAVGPLTMLPLRFMVGVGCGIGFPTVYSLIPEVCPANWRGPVSTLMIGFMPLGELYAALGVLLFDRNLDHTVEGCESGYYPAGSLVDPADCAWKALCEFSAMPAFACLAFTAVFLNESPLYLAAQGRCEEAQEVLTAMAKMNRVDAHFNILRPPAARSRAGGALPTPPEYSFRDAVGRLFGPRFGSTAVFLSFAHFVKDFGLFGLSYALPQYFVFLQSLSAGAQLAIVAALAGPGVLVAFFLTRRKGRARVAAISASAGLCAAFTLGMLDAAPTWMSAPCAYVVKLLALIYFILTVVYTADAFPTAIRNTAVGLCTCLGRGGSIAAPLLLEVTLHHLKSFDAFLWCLFACMAAVSATAPFCLGAGDSASSESEGLLASGAKVCSKDRMEAAS